MAHINLAGDYIEKERDPLDAGHVCEGLVKDTFWKQEGKTYNLKNMDGTCVPNIKLDLDGQYWCDRCDNRLTQLDHEKDGRGWSCGHQQHWGSWRRTEITRDNVASRFNKADARLLDVALLAGTDTPHLLRVGEGGVWWDLTNTHDTLEVDSGLIPDDIPDAGIGFLIMEGRVPVVILGKRESGAARLPVVPERYKDFEMGQMVHYNLIWQVSDEVGMTEELRCRRNLAKDAFGFRGLERLFYIQSVSAGVLDFRQGDPAEMGGRGRAN